MPEYIKTGPHGFCQRCGWKYPLSELQADGYRKEMRVCEECYEEDNPQRYPVPIAGDESVLYNPLPPNEQFPVNAVVGGHYELTSLTLITPAAMTILGGTAFVVTV